MAYKAAPPRHRSGAIDTAALLLRLGLGVLILLHGFAKLGTGPSMIMGLVAKTGLPPELGYLVYVGEILAPLLLIFGIWTRLAAMIVAINMLVAVFLVHTAELMMLTKNGGYALELQAIYLIVALAIAFLGAGRFSLAGEDGRWN